jgi:pimeloyl-ACP methyl ester carboxylesterase
MGDEHASLHVLEWPALRAAPAGSLPHVLVHGSMDRSTSFTRLARYLSGVQVISYDRRGYARSSGRAPSERFSDQVADLMEVLAGRRVVAFGHSFGGGVVLAAAAAHPEAFAAAVVWEPPMPWLPWWPATTAGSRALSAAATRSDPGEAAERFMLRMVGPDVWGRLGAATRARRRAEGPALLADMRAIRSAPWDPVQVEIPVLVGCGSRSQAHHVCGASVLAEALPLGQLRVLDGAGHGAHLSHPAELAGLLGEAGRLGTPRPAAAESGVRVADEEGRL